MGVNKMFLLKKRIFVLSIFIFLLFFSMQEFYAINVCTPGCSEILNGCNNCADDCALFGACIGGGNSGGGPGPGDIGDTGVFCSPDVTISQQCSGNTLITTTTTTTATCDVFTDTEYTACNTYVSPPSCSYSCKNSFQIKKTCTRTVNGCFNNSCSSTQQGNTSTINCPPNTQCVSGQCVNLNQPPTANFTATPQNGSAPLEVVFDASSSNDADGTIITYSWEFIDKSNGSQVGTSIKTTPDYSFTFPDPGKQYIAYLTVTDDKGATNQASKSITTNNNQPPNALFIMYVGSAENEVSVVNPGTEITFNASASSDPDGDALTFNWDFGDSQNGTGKTTTHTYNTSGTYNVKVTVTDNFGATDTTSKNIRINNSPIALMNDPSPNPVEPGEQISFDASPSNDPDGDALTFNWDFGDSQNGTGKTTTHTYNTSGTYNVKVTVTDAYGLSDTSNPKQVIVNFLPVVDFQVVPPTPLANTEASFLNKTTDADGSALEWLWDFDDAGATSTEKNPTHTFQSTGTYNVKLTATDPLTGQTASKEKSVTVTDIQAIGQLLALNKILSENNTTTVEVYFNCTKQNNDTVTFRFYNKQGEELSSEFGILQEKCNKNIAKTNEISVKPGLYIVKATMDVSADCKNCPKSSEFVIAEGYKSSVPETSPIATVIVILFVIGILSYK